MAGSHNTTHWLDHWWPLLLILFGIVFVSCLVTFHPY